MNLLTLTVVAFLFLRITPEAGAFDALKAEKERTTVTLCFRPFAIEYTPERVFIQTYEVLIYSENKKAFKLYSPFVPKKWGGEYPTGFY